MEDGPLPHLPGLLRVAARRRSNQARLRLVLGAAAIAFGVYITGSLWQLGVPLVAGLLGGVILLNGVSVALGVLQLRPLVRVENEGIWIRRSWPGVAQLRLALALAGVAVALGCALALWLIGDGVVGLYLVVVSVVNVVSSLAQPVPIVRLAGPAPQAGPGPWTFVPWPAVRKVHPSQHLGLVAGITLDVDPAGWRQLPG